MNAKKYLIVGHTQLGGPCVIDFCDQIEDAGVKLRYHARRSGVRKVELFERVAKKNLPTRERPRRAVRCQPPDESDQ